MTHKKFATLLQDWRTRKKYSQRDAAEKLGCSKRSLENWEQKRAMPQGFGLSAMLKIIQGTETSVKVKLKRKQVVRRKKK
jgi:DNA-binding transcriptional regulator YiaG